MTFDHFKISGTGEALLDVNNLFGAQFNSDNVQGFVTKWDEALLSMTKVPEQDTLEKWYKNSSTAERNRNLLLTMYLQDSVQKGEAASSSRLNGMGRRQIKQKTGTTISMPAPQMLKGTVEPPLNECNNGLSSK